MCLLYLSYKSDKVVLDNLIHRENMKKRILFVFFNLISLILFAQVERKYIRQGNSEYETSSYNKA